MAANPPQDIDNAIDEMWNDATNQISQISPAMENWKAQTLPLARIKKIMKSEEGIYQELERERLMQQAATTPGPPNLQGPNTRFMIAGEAPVLLGKASELLIKELTVRAWRHTERNRRRTLQRQDVHAAVGESEVYDFLIDIVPRITTSQVPTQRGGYSGATDGVAQPAQVAAAAPPGLTVGMTTTTTTTQQQPPQPQPTQEAVMLSDTNMRFPQFPQMPIHEHYMLQFQQAQGQDPQQLGVATNATVAQQPAASVATAPGSVLVNPTAFAFQQTPDIPGVQWGPIPTNGNNNPLHPPPGAGL